MRYIGVDLHKTKLQVCYFNKEENKYQHKTFKIEEFAKFKTTLKTDDFLAFESTSNSNWCYHECKSLVSKIVVVDPFQFKVIATSNKKTDKEDAKLLAYYLSLGENLLPACKVKSKSLQLAQSLFLTRKSLVEQGVQCKNQIHALFLSVGKIINPSDLNSKIGLQRLEQQAATLDDILKFAINIQLQQLSSLSNLIKEIDDKLLEVAKQMPGYTNLKSIYGLGTNTIVMLLATIGKIEDFASERHLSSFLGIVPKVHNSNESIHHGRITKTGNSVLRGNLIQCAMVAIKRNKLLSAFYQRLKTKTNHGNAIVATARKLVELVYYTLKHSWFFTAASANDAIDEKNKSGFIRSIREINWQSAVA